jgi:phage baseplate assembly protein gpV
MNRYEFEGTILPSSLVSDSGAKMRSNIDFPSLYVGRVQRVHYPDSDANANKRYPEYDVVIEYESHGNRIRTATIIHRCRVASLFGGIADFETWTPRVAVKDPMAHDATQKQAGQKLETGSQVLVLCLTGSSQQGIIVGGLPHTEGDVQDKTEGHHWTRRFNGVTMNIDAAGQFTLSFQGATGAAGGLLDSADPEASGSQMTFVKDGSIKLETKDGQQSIHLDHANNKIAVRANASLEITGLDPDGETPKFQLTMNDGELTVRLQDGATLAVVGKDGDTRMTVGDGSKHVAIVEELQALYTQLKTKLDVFDAHIHATGVGPSGPPTPTIGAPSWNSAINSTKVSIPEG